MTEEDERAATERMRLLLVHNVESQRKNLAADPADGPSKGGDETPADECYDLSKLAIERFPARTPIASTTDAHRTAAYSTSAEPVAPVPVSQPISSILVDAALTEEPSSALSREVVTVRRRPLPPRDTSRDGETVLVGHRRESRQRARLFAAAMALLAVGLILFAVVTRTPGGTEVLPAQAAVTKAATPPVQTAAPVVSPQISSAPKDLAAPAVAMSAAPACVIPPPTATPAKPPRPPAEDTTPRAANTKRDFE